MSDDFFDLCAARPEEDEQPSPDGRPKPLRVLWCGAPIKDPAELEARYGGPQVLPKITFEIDGDDEAQQW